MLKGVARREILMIKRLHIQMPPITNGMKYHVRFLTSWKICKRVVKANKTIKTIAAIFEGSYL